MKIVWPEDRPLPQEAAFNWSLDGGGRHLMHSLFEQTKIDRMIEFGSFMGGSAREWLSASPTIELVCVDPWPDNLAIYVKNLQNVDWAKKLYDVDNLARYAEILAEHGTVKTVQNNLWDLRHRVEMFRGKAPEVYPVIASLRPDLVFIDALKRRAEFIEAHEAFPDSIIAGDDWTWPDANGHFCVRDFVMEIAGLRNAKVYADRQTFVVCEDRHGLTFDEKYRYTG